MSEEKEKLKKGRKPSLIITEKELKEIKSLSGRGLTQIQIAHYYGITPQTWHKMKRKDPEIDRAVKEGKSRVISIVSGRLLQLIEAGNITAIIFYLKTQAGWTEKSAITIDNNVKSKNRRYKLETTDAVEASKVYQSIMTGSYNNERNRTSK